MADFTKNKSWAATQSLEDKVDDTNLGSTDLGDVPIDADAILKYLEGGYSTSATNFPTSGFVVNLGITSSNSGRGVQFFSAPSGDVYHLRHMLNGVFQSPVELLHSGNTVGVRFGGSQDVSGTLNELNISPTSGLNGNNVGGISYQNNVTVLRNMVSFVNGNGIVGTISTSGTATSYNVSSDPRLKDFKGQPADSVIDVEFNKLFSCFDTFNWKNDPTGQLVWGFDAHLCVDAGLDMGTEGQGSRDLALGDVYNTIPAVIEQQDVQVVYKTGDKKGEPRFNADDSPVMETVDVVVTPEINERVSPAGIDQAKAVPILLAKIEQLERRLVAAGL